jgi:hypothetical protein
LRRLLWGPAAQKNKRRAGFTPPLRRFTKPGAGGVNPIGANLSSVIPAKAGIQGHLIQHRLLGKPPWIPAFAGMTGNPGAFASAPALEEAILEWPFLEAPLSRLRGND